MLVFLSKLGRALSLGSLVALLAAVVFIIGKYDVFSEASALVLHDRQSGRVCSVSWSDADPPCSFHLALRLAQIGLSKRSEGNFIRFGREHEFGSLDRENLKGSLCRALLVEHVGNRGTSVAFSSESNYYVPPDASFVSRLTDFGVRAGVKVNLCSFNHRTYIETSRNFVEAIRLW